MAVAPMLKVTVLGHGGALRPTIDLLQAAGVIEIVSRDVTLADLEAVAVDAERVRELEERIADATFARDLLGRYRTYEAPFSTFISEKVHIGVDEFDALEPDEAFVGLYWACERIAERIADIERERTRLHALVAELAPWESLRLEISQWQDTEHVALFCGTVPEAAAAEIRQTLRDAVEYVSVAEVGRAAEREAWVVMAHRDVLDEVRSTLLLTEFVAASFPDLTGYPAEERVHASERLEVIAAEQAEIESEAEALAEEHHARVTALVQALLTRKDAEEVKGCFTASERAFVASGWVPAARKNELVAALAPVGSDVDVSFAEPEPGDAVPVELANPALIRPFEVLTDLYGRPRYGDLDPTPFFAGFYFFFFGLCIGDAGYGALLAAAAYLIKNKLDVAPGVRKFMDLLMLGGVASAIVGVATRSYFALSEESLPAFLRYQPIVDPLPGIMIMLAFSVALGVVHVSLGVIVNAYRRIKAGDVAGALFEELTTIALFLVVGVVLVWPATIGWLLPWSLGAAVVLKGRVLERLFVDRSLGGTAAGVGKGLLGLYGLVGYASDFLSYTRLAALGLASLLVGDTMNRLAGLVSEIPFGVGLVGAILILVVGHAFNVVIALLGAFVHSTRLQFVEFFSKFYEGGGRPFAPFAPRTKQVVLHPATGESEGGVR